MIKWKQKCGNKSLYAANPDGHRRSYASGLSTRMRGCDRCILIYMLPHLHIHIHIHATHCNTLHTSRDIHVATPTHTYTHTHTLLTHITLNHRKRSWCEHTLGGSMAGRLPHVYVINYAYLLTHTTNRGKESWARIQAL